MSNHLHRAWRVTLHGVAEQLTVRAESLELDGAFAQFLDRGEVVAIYPSTFFKRIETVDLATDLPSHVTVPTRAQPPASHWIAGRPGKNFGVVLDILAQGPMTRRDLRTEFGRRHGGESETARRGFRRALDAGLKNGFISYDKDADTFSLIQK